MLGISLLRPIRDKSSRNELSAATDARKYVQDHDSRHNRLREKDSPASLLRDRTLP